MEVCEMGSDSDAETWRAVLHHMLGLALIEIRAVDSLDVATKIASIFHVLPMALLRCSTSEDYQVQLADVLERSKRVGLEKYVRGVLSVAEKSVVRRDPC
jgi:hypothetical protein